MASNPKTVVMAVSLGASVLMLAGKLTAYFLTDSAAIFSDAAESVVHGVATGFAAFSLWLAARPPDTSHPYGHGRIAYLSAGFEGGLVLAASVAVIYSGIDAFLHERALRQLGVGLTICGALALVNLALGVSLVLVGKSHASIILIANGRHVLSDMWTTVAAILGVGLVLLTGEPWLDPLTALVIGLFILYSGMQIIRSSIRGLMDEASSELSAKLVGVLDRAVEERVISEYHQLRFRKVNDEIWVEVHVLVPGEFSVSEAHARVDRVENAIRHRFEGQPVRITSHVEPADHESAHPEGHPEIADPFSRGS